MPNTLDFSTWNFANVGLAPKKLGLATNVVTTNITGDITTETTARIAADSAEAAVRSAADTVLSGDIGTETTNRSNADTVLQGQITSLQASVTELQQPRYSTVLLFGGS